ncbi:MAG: metallophosphoesterase [Polyangiaceae bacterium]|nr:metallophosphoesterase [Polyangiaceae bacterium]MCW5792404.1 metallophosphoesterase [Polyangiaceae bacterium]
MLRREFLTSSLGIGAGLLLPGVIGCSSDSEPASPKPLDLGPRHPVQKGPYVQLVGGGRARLRLETSFDEPAHVLITRGGKQALFIPTRNAETLDYSRTGLNTSVPDVPGLHVLHEIEIEDLEPGEVVNYTVPLEEGEITGSFKAPPASDAPVRIGWIADTMFPMAEEQVALLASHAPDVVLHGGDINYDPNPFDTWNGTMAGFAPLFRLAPMHFVLGNHEFESQDEITVQYERLFAGQGDTGSTARYFAFSYGMVRFICLDSESGKLAEVDPPQLDWLDAELASATLDPNIREVIVAFHRPTYTLSKHGVSDITVRSRLHQRFVDHGVRLVLAGHAHSFERFVVEGVTYIIDGGGGALLYDPDEDREKIEELRPGESALRVAVDRSYGITLIDVTAEGALKVLRQRKDGEVIDEWELPAR